MGIGTSLGAYYEDPLSHEAGVDKDYLKPKETNDNNVVTPPEVRQNKEMDKIEETELGGIPISNRIYVSPNREDIDRAPFGMASPGEIPEGSQQGRDLAEYGDKLGKGENRVVDKLLGIRGQERYQMWPERLVRDVIDTFHKGMNGKIPGYVVDPDTGEFHTSPEMLEAAETMLPFTMGSTLFPKSPVIQLRGPAHDALTEGPDAFRQFMATRGSRQPSNINDSEALVGTTGNSRYVPSFEAETPMSRPSGSMNMEEWEAAEQSARRRDFQNWENQQDFRQEPFTDHMSDHEFYSHGLQQRPGEMTPAQEGRWADVDRRLSQEDRNRLMHDSHTEEFGLHDDFHTTIEHEPYDHVEARTRYLPDEVRQKFLTAKNSDNAKLIRENNPEEGYGRQIHKFLFASKEGTGEMRLGERNNGKDLYVNWIGTLDGTRELPNTFGTKQIRDILSQLKQEFPNAQTISGFRVSGARYFTGSGPADAQMRLRPAKEK